MAINCLVKGVMGGEAYQVDTMNVASGTTASIAVGDMVTIASGVAAKSADGDVTNAGQFGIALSTSTETASAAGTVDVAYATALKIGIKATTPANLTAAMLYVGKNLDVSAGVQTLDQGASGKIMIKSYDDTTNGNCVCYLPFSLA